MERMSARPHHAGSAGSKAVAEYILGEMKEWGLDAHLETFSALLPYPTSRSLEMIAPTRFRARLQEPAIPQDQDTSDPGQLPTFNAYSASGDVTAPLVYVNYGTPEDYEWLKREGIDVKGRIVIARYGHGWRGVKAKVAQDAGAVGCLIYSDPHEDGYYINDTYPLGPMRPSQGVQRGSVMDISLYPGDPLTPGWASEPGARRLPRSEAKTILKIPVMPISYADARPLLEAMDGEVVPDNWKGALPITYHTGPGPSTVHFKIDFDWTNKPVNDVIVDIPGSLYKDQWIIYGNHHDAWVNGASDPASGAAALLETARTLAKLRQQGWQPKRTIVLALWDGEEFGLVGSTEWAEKHQEELDHKAVVYLNSDSNGRGRLSAGGSHVLEPFMREVLRDLTEPVSGKPLVETARPHRGFETGEFHLGSLGAGSDYVAFLDHLGISSLNLGFGGADSGVYHSVYDTMNWYTRFSDTDFVYGRALSQLMTTTLLRLADAPVLPFEFQSFARTLRVYLDDLQREAQRYSATIDLHEVHQQLGHLFYVSRAYDEELSGALRRVGSIPPERLAKINEAVFRTERTLLLPDGLPRREWYRNQIYAPGSFTGYGAKTLPGVREALESQRYDEANQQARRLAQVLHSMAVQIEDATRLLKQACE